MSDREETRGPEHLDDLPPAQAKTEEVRGGADSLSELSGEQQLSLQATMDRYTKAQQTISNVMKSSSDTSSSIVSNLK